MSSCWNTMVAKLCLKHLSFKSFVNFDIVKDMSKILLHFSFCFLVFLCSSIHDRKPPPLRLSTSFSGFHCCRGFYTHKWPREFSGYKQNELNFLFSFTAYNASTKHMSMWLSSHPRLEYNLILCISLKAFLIPNFLILLPSPFLTFQPTWPTDGQIFRTRRKWNAHSTNSTSFSMQLSYTRHTTIKLMTLWGPFEV